MKIIAAILAYDNWKRVTACMDRFYRETDLEFCKTEMHVFFCGYPLPSIASNLYQIKTHALIKGATFHHIPNRGQDGNNFQIGEALRELDYDLCVIYDADVKPKSTRWLHDAVKIFKADPNCDLVTTNCSVTDNAIKWQHPVEEVAGVKVAKLKLSGGWPFFIFRKAFLTQGYDKTHSFYGGTEANIFHGMTKRGTHGYMMAEHDDARCLAGIDMEYLRWKQYAIDNVSAISFDDWLKSNV